jgi:hypothetical protein
MPFFVAAKAEQKLISNKIKLDLTIHIDIKSESSCQLLSHRGHC